MPEIRITSQARGPMFDGRAARAAAAYCDDAEQAVAEHAADMVRRRLHQVLRNPTGYYESQIRVERSRGGVAVTDGGVVYGPWLEGTGSRNSPVTRFPGYATFRMVNALVRRDARGVALRRLPRFTRGM